MASKPPNKDDEKDRFIERTEHTLSSPRPSQITRNKKKIPSPASDGKSGLATSCAVSNAAVDSSLVNSKGDTNKNSSLQRSEVTVEMKGLRETNLSCSETVVSSRVRTVMGRGSSSDVPESARGESPDGKEDAPEGDDNDSAFSEKKEFVFGGALRDRGSSSDSYYISQTYQISSPTARIVSAVSSPRSFKTSRTFSFGSGDENKDESSSVGQFVERKEETLPSPESRPAGVERRVKFAGVEDTEGVQEKQDTEPSEVSERLKSAREDVQHMIETSYMVSDITDVINDQMCQSTPTKGSRTSNGKQSSDSGASSVIAYSPGAAIRSYTLEELAEKRSRENTPEIDSSKPDDSKPASRPSVPDQDLQGRASSQTQKDDEGSSVDACIVKRPSSLSSTGNKVDQSLDHLVDIDAIMQAGYRFHDVGMMLTPEISASNCSSSISSHHVTSSENKSASVLSQIEATQIPPNNHNVVATSMASLIQADPVNSLSLRSSDDTTSYKDSVIASQQAVTTSTSFSSRIEKGGKLISHPNKNITEQKISNLTQVSATANIKSQATSSSTLPAQSAISQANNRSALTKKSLPPPVSVSRRFNIKDKKFESSLKARGAVLRSDSISFDVYYDTADLDLTRADCWLRSHNGLWQLHANFTKLLNDNTKDEYFQTEDISEIISFLSKLLNLSNASDDDISSPTPSLSRFIHRAGLTELVRYTTTRRTYSLQFVATRDAEQVDLEIELCMPQYGFWVGHVTSTVCSTDGLSRGLGSIDALWKDAAHSSSDIILTVDTHSSTGLPCHKRAGGVGEEREEYLLSCFIITLS